ncbi:MAG: xanthine dehydrogenase family protein subunit M [Syntrophorhabdaceae bacterium]|nr:xanthine dehydrogenase family protein subunit M [Syntrophorhabdaceae bacterium]
MRRFEYHKPETIKEALGLVTSLNNARFIAGGTDILVALRQKKAEIDNLISLRNIGELKGIEYGDGLWIGSGTTHTEILKSRVILEHYTALNDGVKNLGSRQIRNVATIGGNICNAAPSADTACPLLVLDAKVLIAGINGERWVDLDGFFLGPNKTVLDKHELVKGFSLPLFPKNTGSSYIKHTRRAAMDLPILGIAARITMDDGKEGATCREARIAMGVVAPRPIRAYETERFLVGKPLTEDVMEEAGNIAAREATPRDSIRGQAWYRKEMVKVLVGRAIKNAMERMGL